MKLMHSTYDLERVKRILEKGIKRNDKAYLNEIKNPEKIPFVAMPEAFPFAKGDYLFVLREMWFETHKEQFRANYVNSSPEFIEWVKKSGLKDFESLLYPKAHNEILSLGAVPLSGIESLVVPETTLTSPKFKEIVIPQGIALETYKR